MFCLNFRSQFIFLLLFTSFVFTFTIFTYPDKNTDDVYQQLSLEDLMNIKITTAGKMIETIGQTPASIVVINREEIEIFGYLTLTEILENIPGLYNIEDYSNGGSNFGVRGFWSGLKNKNMIIMLNGVSQINDINSANMLGYIDISVEAIDRIEVVRGPMSIIYGSGAFYGAINIITNQGLKKNKSKVSFSSGSNKTYNFFLKKSGQIGEIDYTFNAGYTDTNGIDEPFSKMVSNPSILPLFGISEDKRTGGTLESNKKYFSLSLFHNGLTLNTFYMIADTDDIFLLPPPTDGSKAINTRMTFFAGYKKNISQKIILEGKFTYKRSQIFVKLDNLFEDFYGLQQVESSSVEAEFNGYFDISSKLNFTSGLYIKSILNVYNMYDLPSFGSPSLINNYFFLNNNNNINTRAVFTQMNFTPFNKLKLVAGLRLEQMPEYELSAILAGGTENFSKLEGIYSKDKIEIIPRFAAIFTLNEDNIFKFLYGKATNRPSFFQNTKNSLNPSIDDLQPESIQTLEFNYLGVISQKLTLNLSIFRNFLDNLMTRVVKFDENNNYQTWSGNAGEMVTNGLEFTVLSEPFNDLRFEFSGVYQKTEDKREEFKDIIPAYSPNMLAYMKAWYRFSKTASIAITGNYVGKMETYWDQTLKNEDGTFGRRIGDIPSPAYFLFGANLRVNMLNSGFYINLRCSNLLNQEVRYPTFTNNSWADRGTIGFSRRFLLTIGYNIR